jgi:hypothetical protein
LKHLSNKSFNLIQELHNENSSGGVSLPGQPAAFSGRIPPLRVSPTFEHNNLPPPPLHSLELRNENGRGSVAAQVPLPATFNKSIPPPPLRISPTFGKPLPPSSQQHVEYGNTVSLDNSEVMVIERDAPNVLLLESSRPTTTALGGRNRRRDRHLRLMWPRAAADDESSNAATAAATAVEEQRQPPLDNRGRPSSVASLSPVSSLENGRTGGASQPPPPGTPSLSPVSSLDGGAGRQKQSSGSGSRKNANKRRRRRRSLSRDLSASPVSSSCGGEEDNDEVTTLTMTRKMGKPRENLVDFLVSKTAARDATCRRKRNAAEFYTVQYIFAA